MPQGYFTGRDGRVHPVSEPVRYRGHTHRMPSSKRKRGDPPKRYEYSTVHGGTQKVTSEEQHQLLHAKHLPHTHVFSDGSRERSEV